MTSLNISKNDIGELVLPDGWSHSRKFSDRDAPYKHTDGRRQKEPPADSSPDGVIALAGAIKNSRVLAILDLSTNRIPNDQQINLTSICNRKNISIKL